MRGNLDIEFTNVYGKGSSVNPGCAMYLGAVADDVTGGTDLASLLRRAGMDVVQTWLR